MRNSDGVLVWDIGVRLSHWLLVASFAGAYLTQAGAYEAHLYTGYAVLALLAFRLVWGFVGTRHARFADFLFAPATVLAYLRDMARLRPPRYLGHNPAGGMMILALLLALLTVTISGVALDAAENRAGPLAATRLFLYTGIVADLHDASTSATLALIAVHLCGVLYSSLVHRENLVRAMLTGRKAPRGSDTPARRGG